MEVHSFAFENEKLCTDSSLNYYGKLGELLFIAKYLEVPPKLQRQSTHITPLALSSCHFNILF